MQIINWIHDGHFGFSRNPPHPPAFGAPCCLDPPHLSTYNCTSPPPKSPARAGISIRSVHIQPIAAGSECHRGDIACQAYSPGRSAAGIVQGISHLVEGIEKYLPLEFVKTDATELLRLLP